MQTATPTTPPPSPTAPASSSDDDSENEPIEEKAAEETSSPNGLSKLVSLLSNLIEKKPQPIVITKLSMNQQSNARSKKRVIKKVSTDKILRLMDEFKLKHAAFQQIEDAETIKLMKSKLDGNTQPMYLLFKEIERQDFLFEKLGPRTSKSTLSTKPSNVDDIKQWSSVNPDKFGIIAGSLQARIILYALPKILDSLKDTEDVKQLRLAFHAMLDLVYSLFEVSLGSVNASEQSMNVITKRVMRTKPHPGRIWNTFDSFSALIKAAAEKPAKYASTITSSNNVCGLFYYTGKCNSGGCRRDHSCPYASCDGTKSSQCQHMRARTDKWKRLQSKANNHFGAHPNKYGGGGGANGQTPHIPSDTNTQQSSSAATAFKNGKKGGK